MTGLKVLTDSRGAPGAAFCPWMYGKPEHSYLLHLPALSVPPLILLPVALRLETPFGGCIFLCFLLLIMLLTPPCFSSLCCLEHYIHDFPSLLTECLLSHSGVSCLPRTSNTLAAVVPPSFACCLRQIGSRGKLGCCVTGMFLHRSDATSPSGKLGATRRSASCQGHAKRDKCALFCHKRENWMRTNLT